MWTRVEISRSRSAVLPLPSTAPRPVSPPELGLQTTRRDTPWHADNTTSPCRGGLTGPSGGDVCRTASRDRGALRGRARDVPEVYDARCALHPWLAPPVLRPQVLAFGRLLT